MSAVTPIRWRRRRSIAAAIGDRQMLAVQTMTIVGGDSVACTSSSAVVQSRSRALAAGVALIARRRNRASSHDAEINHISVIGNASAPCAIRMGRRALAGLDGTNGTTVNSASPAAGS